MMPPVRTQESPFIVVIVVVSVIERFAAMSLACLEGEKETIAVLKKIACLEPST